LLLGHEASIKELRDDPNLFLLESRALPVRSRRKAYFCIGLMALVAVASATKLLSPGFVIPLAAVLAILGRCIGVRQAYGALDMQALVVVGGMIPFGYALEETGTAERLGQALAAWLSPMGTWAVLCGLLLGAVFLTQLIENAAVAVILAPIAYELAVSSGANPAHYCLGVAICVSSAFMTPVSHESTILVMGPGRYRFRDYLVVGAPMAAITWLVTAVVVGSM
jgi:di/tricarboxylate transporter